MCGGPRRVNIRRAGMVAGVGDRGALRSFAVLRAPHGCIHVNYPDQRSVYLVCSTKVSSIALSGYDLELESSLIVFGF